MSRFRSSLLLIALAAVCLPQTSTTLVTPEIRRVGDRLACKCGACNNTVGTCPMIQCRYALPAREKIAEMQKAGAGDEAIVDSFVKENGIVALAQPPQEGFNRLGTIMPVVAIAFGIVLIGLYVKSTRKPKPLPEIEPVDLGSRERYRERIEKELADLD